MNIKEETMNIVEQTMSCIYMDVTYTYLHTIHNICTGITHLLPLNALELYIITHTPYQCGSPVEDYCGGPRENQGITSELSVDHQDKTKELSRNHQRTFSGSPGQDQGTFKESPANSQWINVEHQWTLLDVDFTLTNPSASRRGHAVIHFFLFIVILF